MHHVGSQSGSGLTVTGVPLLYPLTMNRRVCINNVSAEQPVGYIVTFWKPFSTLGVALSFSVKRTSWSADVVYSSFRATACVPSVDPGELSVLRRTQPSANVRVGWMHIKMATGDLDEGSLNVLRSSTTHLSSRSSLSDVQRRCWSPENSS